MACASRAVDLSEATVRLTLYRTVVHLLVSDEHNYVGKFAWILEKQYIFCIKNETVRCGLFPPSLPCKT